MDKPHTTRAVVALVAGGVIIGCSPILVRLSEVGPLATAMWRLSLALLPLAFVARREGNQTRRRLVEYWPAALPGVFLAADLAAWQTSLHMTSVANSTLLVNMTPIFVTLGGWLFWKQRISRVFLTGLVLSVVGIFVLKGGVPTSSDAHLAGDAVALTAAIFYASYIQFLSRARQAFRTSTIMLWSTISASLCTLPLALALESHVVPGTLRGWLVVLALAWLTHAAGQGLIAYAVASLPPAFSSLTLLIQPVVAALLAVVILNEPLTSLQIFGGLIILAGIGVAKRG